MVEIATCQKQQRRIVQEQHLQGRYKQTAANEEKDNDTGQAQYPFNYPLFYNNFCVISI